MSTTLATLKRLREVHGLSQMEIHRKTGINQTRLSRWESGDVAGAADAALKLKALSDSLDAKLQLEPVAPVAVPEPAQGV